MSKNFERFADITGSVVGAASAAAIVASIVAGDVTKATISGAVFGSNASVYATRCDWSDEQEDKKDEE